jgi:hypothetical protein
MDAGFEGSKCETPVTPTKKPSPGKSSGSAAQALWVVPVVIILIVILVVVIALVVVKWRKSLLSRPHASNLASNTTSFVNPLYNSEDAKPVLANPTYEAAPKVPEPDYYEPAAGAAPKVPEPDYEELSDVPVNPQYAAVHRGTHDDDDDNDDAPRKPSSSEA